MAVIRPFLGLRYQESAGDLRRLVAPAADEITSEQREKLAAQDERNIVHALLPEASPDDRSKYIRYGRSAARLHAWRREGFLAADPTPAYYRVTQSFDFPDPVVRRSVLALIRPDRYDSGMVLAQSRAVHRVREEKQRLIEAARTHFEPATFVVDEDGGELDAFLASVPVAQGFQFKDSAEVAYTIEPIVDVEAQATLTELLKQCPTWLADNVEAVEAALEAGGSAVSNPKYAEGYVLGQLMSAETAAATAHPSPRRIPKFAWDVDTVRTRLEKVATVEISSAQNVSSERFQLFKSEQPRVSLFFSNGSILRLTPKEAVNEPITAWAFREVLQGLTGQARDEDWSPVTHEYLDERLGAEGGIGLLLRDSPRNLLAIAGEGSRYPARSVDYWPRFPSGLLMWSLNDF